MTDRDRQPTDGQSARLTPKTEFYTRFLCSPMRCILYFSSIAKQMPTAATLLLHGGEAKKECLPRGEASRR
jgi:hypothetical protein